MKATALIVVLASVAVGRLTNAEAEPAAQTAWELRCLPIAEQHQNPADSEFAIDCSDWRSLRSYEWYNTINDLSALPGLDLMWAVGDSRYGPEGVVTSNGDPVVCRSTDGGFYWELAQPAFSSNSIPDASVTLYKVHFFDHTRGIAAGRASGLGGRTAVIYQTNDAGNTWSLVFEGPPAAFPPHVIVDLAFADDLNGWAVGAIDQLTNVAILRTVDGGNTWTPQQSPINAAFTQVSFVDANNGFVVANEGYTLVTTDGGSQWTVASQRPDVLSAGALAMHFIDANIGLATNVGGLILRTTDGGAHWSVAHSAPRILWELSFVDAAAGWAVGEYGATAYTGDAGVTWQDMLSLPDLPDLVACVATTADRVWAAGEWGSIGYTLDRGVSWQNVEGHGYITTAALTDVEFLNEWDGWIAGDGGEIVHTTDGGETWRHVIRAYTNIAGIDFVDRLRGWFATSDAVWHTEDGGESWNEIATLPPSVIDIKFHDEEHGWASGTFGAIHRTTDGGTMWVESPSGTDEGLYAIEFVSNDTGWIVGWSGTILHTTDGGQTWQPQEAPVVEPLYDVTFVDELTGWIAGFNHIVATDDGGVTWEIQHSVSGGAINGVHFADADVGMAVGGYADHSFVFLTSDGGTTWRECDVGPPGLEHKLRHVHMPSGELAYAAGVAGWVLRFRAAATAIGDALPTMPLALESLSSRPNPFHGATRLGFRLNTPSSVAIDIFDSAGRRVFTRRLGIEPAGERWIPFNGVGNDGAPLPSGVYFQELTAGGTRATSKLVVVR